MYYKWSELFGYGTALPPVCQSCKQVVCSAALPTSTQGGLHSCETSQTAFLCADPNINLPKSISEWGGIFAVHCVHLFSSWFYICSSELLLFLISTCKLIFLGRPMQISAWSVQLSLISLIGEQGPLAYGWCSQSYTSKRSTAIH